MSFTQSARVWWNTSKPGSGTAFLTDADVPTTPVASDDSGIENRPTNDRWVICARSGFPFPIGETVIDPNTGMRVAAIYADPIPSDKIIPPTPPPPVEEP